jgi:ribosomal protein S1
MNTSEANVSVQGPVVDGAILIGTVIRPFIDQNKLRGAILSFAGREETALLHIRQIKGEEPEKRLSGFCLGDEIKVKIIVNGPACAPKIWASEKALEPTLLERLNAVIKSKCVVRGRVANVCKGGLFVDLIDGPIKGERGLIHNANLYQKGAELASLCKLLQPNSEVLVQVLGASFANALDIDLVLYTAERMSTLICCSSQEDSASCNKWNRF